MSDLANLLHRARSIYANAPSHAKPGDYPRPGTYCTITAIMEASASLRATYQLQFDAEAALERVTGTQFLVEWNASSTTRQVLAAFERAIEATS